MKKALEKSGFALVSFDQVYLSKNDPGYEQRMEAAKEAVLGVKSDYYSMGDYYSVWGVYDAVVEVMSDGMASTKLAAETIRKLRIGGERVIASALPVVIIEGSRLSYGDAQPITCE